MRTYNTSNPPLPSILWLLLSNYQRGKKNNNIKELSNEGFVKHLIVLVDGWVVIVVLKGKIKGGTYRYETIQLCN